MNLPSPDDPRLLDRLDAAAEEFSTATMREYYLNGSGQKRELEIQPVYERYAWLFDREMVEAVLAAQLSDERLPHLRQFVVEGYLERAVAGVTEELAGRETNDIVEWDGQEVSYRSLPVLIANEAEPRRRHALDALRLHLTSGQNGLRERRWEVLYGRAMELGFNLYAALWDEVKGLDLDHLAAQMQDFLRRTEGPYRSELRRRLADAGMPPAWAEKSDLAYLFRAPDFDPIFDGERLLPALTATLRSLGIDPDRQGNVHLDTEQRPLKSARAFCAPIRIPDEVMLVISPHGGQDDYQALFHEAGHAQHFAHTDPALPFAFRGLGDNSVTEAHAFLVEHLLTNSTWLRLYLDFAEADGYLAFNRFRKLYMLRRYAAKLLYELHLHRSGEPRGHGKLYADLLTATLAVRYAAEDYLADVDDGFYVAQYLRAWIFEAQHRRYLEDRYGSEWFLDREAAEAVRAMWGTGQRYDAGRLARQIGYDGLDADPLIQELSVG